MATNYGIGFCKKVIQRLEKLEDRMFDEKGYGFNMISKEYIELMRYKGYLKTFLSERDDNSLPSYDPAFHGSFDN